MVTHTSTNRARWRTMPLSKAVTIMMHVSCLSDFIYSCCAITQVIDCRCCTLWIIRGLRATSSLNQLQTPSQHKDWPSCRLHSSRMSRLSTLYMFMCRSRLQRRLYLNCALTVRVVFEFFARRYRMYLMYSFIRTSYVVVMLNFWIYEMNCLNSKSDRIWNYSVLPKVKLQNRLPASASGCIL